MAFQLLDETMEIVSNVMQYVLWVTIGLGAIFLLVILIMIAKKIKYNRQMKNNKKELEKLEKQNAYPPYPQNAFTQSSAQGFTPYAQAQSFQQNVNFQQNQNKNFQNKQTSNQQNKKANKN